MFDMNIVQYMYIVFIKEQLLVNTYNKIKIIWHMALAGLGVKNISSQNIIWEFRDKLTKECAWLK